jgi:hypothetical protein
MPNHLFPRTCSGQRRKPGLMHVVRHLKPYLRRSPLRAGSLKR